MKSLRWLLLIALVIVAGAVYRIYRTQRTVRRAAQRPVPASVPLDTRASAVDWEWGQSSDGHPAVKISAKNFTQSAETNKAHLQGIELRIFQKDGQHYDRVRTADADFTTDDNKLYAPGDAEITLAVPVEGEPDKPLTSITAAGINFDSKSGEAVTDKPVAFTFANGDGKCIGASYNPQKHELFLMNSALVNLHGSEPGSKTIKVEGGNLLYNEEKALVIIEPWSKLTRDDAIVNAAGSLIQLKDGALDWIDARQVHGTSKQPGRDLEYAAGSVHAEYNDAGQMTKLTATENARLISRDGTTEITTTAARIEMFFTPGKDGESELQTVFAGGNSTVESRPMTKTADAEDTRILKAENIDLHMRPGGREIGHVNTRAAGTLEILPNQPARHRRLLKASHIDVAYGLRNVMESFQASDAVTDTDPSETEKRSGRTGLATIHTTSKTLDATFTPAGDVRQMKQSGDFHYSEGPRKAQSDTATLDSATNVMVLDRKARVSDDTGSTTADHIELQQATGDFEARGNVTTIRLADSKNNASTMLDSSQPMQGSADRVTSANRNRSIRYIGRAVLWQGADRIQADRIDIDREKRTLVADGSVVSQFADKPAAGKTATPGPTVFSTIRAQHLVYTDLDRLAAYTGGVTLNHAALAVKSTALKAFLNDSNSNADSRINKAFGDGAVRIDHNTPERHRIGTGEHAEYYSDEGRIVLSGGQPQLVDNLRGNTKGEKLTYFTDDDRLIVDGAPQKPVESHLKRSKR